MQLLWLAWEQNRYDAQKIADAWRESFSVSKKSTDAPGLILVTANIPGEKAPTKRAVADRIGMIRKGVKEYGVAAYFGDGPSTPKKTRKIMNRANRPLTELAKVDDLDYKSSTNTNGLQSTAKHGATTVREESSNAAIKPEDVDDTVAVDGQQPSQYLATPPKTPGRGFRAVPKRSNDRKRHRPGTDTDNDSASMTTETSRSEISIAAPDFDMKLRPDHRKVSLFESDGEAGSDGSDTAWVPGSDDGRGRRKRLRHQ